MERVIGSPQDAQKIVRDVISEVDGREVRSIHRFRSWIASMDPATKVTFTVLRGGKTLKLEAVLGTLDEKAESGGGAVVPRREDEVSSKLGLRVQELTDELADKLGYTGVKGVLVSNVEPDGPAARAGIEQGDLIVEVARHEVSTLADYKKAMGAADPAKGVLLLVRHGEFTRYVVLKVETD